MWWNNTLQGIFRGNNGKDKKTIATSLAITFISSIGGSIGKVVTGQVKYLPAVIMILASIVAAPIGAKVGKTMNTKALQMILAVLISVTALKIWTDILSYKI